MSFFSKFFKKKHPQLTIIEKLNKASAGDSIRIKFATPRKMGYMHEEETYSRFDPTDYPDRVIIGQIINIRKDKTLNMFIVDVTSIKSSGLRRDYIFIENEIEEFDFLTGAK